MFVVMYGGIGDGMNVVGPFKYVVDAIKYAAWRFHDETSWEVIKLREPEPEKELKPLTREEFLEKRGLACPYCQQQGNLSFVDRERLAPHKIAGTHHCLECNRKHIQHYDLTDWEETVS